MSRAVARPMPFAPPVMIALFPLNRMIACSSSVPDGSTGGAFSGRPQVSSGRRLSSSVDAIAASSVGDQCPVRECIVHEPLESLSRVEALENDIVHTFHQRHCYTMLQCKPPACLQRVDPLCRLAHLVEVVENI